MPVRLGQTLRSSLDPRCGEFRTNGTPTKFQCLPIKRKSISGRRDP